MTMTNEPNDDPSAALLQKLGYKSELERSLSLFENFGIAFCYISPVVGVYSLFGYGLSTAGPAFLWTIPIVAVGQLLVALIFAEVGSSFPLAGALYQWGKLLLGPRFGWMVGWIYGWALLVTIAAVDYAGAPYVAQLFGIEPAPRTNLCIALALLVVHTIFNVVGVKASALITKIGVVGEVAATIVIAGVLIVAGLQQPASVLVDTAGRATESGAYWPLFLAAMLSPVWVFYGFESAGDVAEEVKDPSRKVPKAILMSLVGAVIVTTFLMVTLVLAAPDLPAAMADPNKTVAVIFEARLGKVVAAVTLALIVFAYFSCATAIQAACARLVFAYARDDRIPGAATLKKVSGTSKAPINALLFTGVVAVVAALLTQINVGAVNMNALLVAYASVGIYVAFQLIVLASLIASARGWKPTGAFQLGKWRVVVGGGALVYGVSMIVNLAWPRPSTEPAGFFPLISAALIICSGALVLFVVNPKPNTPPPP